MSFFDQFNEATDASRVRIVRRVEQIGPASSFEPFKLPNGKAATYAAIRCLGHFGIARAVSDYEQVATTNTVSALSRVLRGGPMAHKLQTIAAYLEESLWQLAESRNPIHMLAALFAIERINISLADRYPAEGCGAVAAFATDRAALTGALASTMARVAVLSRKEEMIVAAAHAAQDVFEGFLIAALPLEHAISDSSSRTAIAQ